jgi:hypothetical protein
MAQSLIEDFSPAKCESAAERFLHLSTQISGAEVVTTPVKNALAELQAKSVIFKAAVKTRMFAYDLAQLADSNQDNCIRDTGEACKKYDRDNFGSKVYALVFPQNTTPVIETNFFDEPAEIRKAIDRIRSLGPDHQLFTCAAQLDQFATASETAITNFKVALSKEASCQVELSIAKFNLIRTYNNTILQAQQLFGRKNANKLFPQVRNSSSDDDTNETIEEPELDKATA